MQGLVTVFGGGGFVGRHAVRALAKRGHRVRVAVRRPNLIPELRVMGDVGQIELVQANLRHEDSVRQALVGADVAINLVGVLYPSGPQSFRSVHEEGAGLVARLATEAGVARLVHMSAIGADPASDSRYAQSKAAGEAAARAGFPGLSIVRPSIVFGPEDDFFNRFAAMASVSPVLPLIGGGTTRFQPVYVGDVAQVLADLADGPARAGETFELGGPTVYTFKELLTLINLVTGRNRPLAPVPWPVAGLIGAVGDVQSAILPIPPVLTSDQVRLLRSDNVVSAGAQGLSAFGVTPTPAESIIRSYLWRFRNDGQFAEALGEGA